MCRFFNWYPVGFLNQIADTLGGILLVKVPISENDWNTHSQSCNLFESDSDSNESSVSSQGLEH